MKISIILPVLNEAEALRETLSVLQPFRAEGHEVIVVDGGSQDDSVQLSKPLADQVVSCQRGRSRQMNAGAKIAKGDLFIFLHADTFLPQKATLYITEVMQKKGTGWGRFDVQLSGTNVFFRAIEHLMNLRSRLTGIATGDQAIFIRRQLFESVNGFPDIDLMEDIALSKMLKRHSRPFRIRERVLTSSRRWEKNGIIRTILQMWYLRLAYFLGANPNRLALIYGPIRSL
ncbi:MAG: TIGR04283 family arsenosugar biosynthesis glycosyltransferase [Thermodesulfobacteriota bacterium]